MGMRQEMQENYSAIEGLHQDIFSVSCAIPACHDGSFEPDFRTVQSSYWTLVYHPITKNNKAGDFKYRVIPFDTAQSVLYERITNCCFVNENDRMPFTVGIPLPQKHIDAISDWIMEGAPDPIGQIHEIPQEELSFQSLTWGIPDTEAPLNGYSQQKDQALLPATIIPANERVRLNVVLERGEETITQLDILEFRFSTKPKNFQQAIAKPGIVDSGVGYIDIETNEFPQHQPIYVQVHAQDGKEVVEYPQKGTYVYERTRWAFFIE